MAKWKVKRITVGDILLIMSPWSCAAVYDESIDEDKAKFYTYEDLEKCEFKNREVCAIHANKKGLIDIFWYKLWTIRKETREQSAQNASF